jgi:hypothetical protein
MIGYEKGGKGMLTQPDKLLEGGIDLHCHGYPELSFEVKMRLDDLEALQVAAKAGMKGIMLKSHMWPTVGRVYQLKNQIKEIEVWSSITLNDSVGGLSPWATESALKQGAKLIWMPTWSARNDMERGGFSQFLKRYLTTFKQFESSNGLTLFNRNDEIDGRAKEILALARDYDVPVSTGHLSPEEGLALGREAKQMGFKKLIFCHPDSATVGAQMEHIKAMAEMGFFIEFCFIGMLPSFQRISPKEMAKRIKDVGANLGILTTDTFTERTPAPSEMMRMFIAALLPQGITADEIKTMVQRNPEALLNV